jgi:hypothetical protein
MLRLLTLDAKNCVTLPDKRYLLESSFYRGGKNTHPFCGALGKDGNSC